MEFLSLLEPEELSILKEVYATKRLKKGEYLLEQGKVCHHLHFVFRGLIRQYHEKDGKSLTCCLSPENHWVIDYASFLQEQPTCFYFEALEDTKVISIHRKDLLLLYERFPRFERAGRKIAEQLALRNTSIAISLASEKPEERCRKFLNENRELLQRVPLKYIASYLGITPESLSRIRRRLTLGERADRAQGRMRLQNG
ncbi:MAG: Crp/Fnr family transcriptional regulator [Salibacteraceae bacterium]